MITGVGVDIVEVARFRDLLDAGNEQFLENTFSAEERAYCSSYTDAAIHFAGTFAAKEAIKKATGNVSLPLNQIHVHRSVSGKPEVFFAQAPQPSILLTISHIAVAACAVAIQQSV